MGMLIELAQNVWLLFSALLLGRGRKGSKSFISSMVIKVILLIVIALGLIFVVLQFLGHGAKGGCAVAAILTSLFAFLQAGGFAVAGC